MNSRQKNYLILSKNRLDILPFPMYYNQAFAGLAHLVERHLAKVEVASSSLVTRSKRGSIAQLGEHLPYKQGVTGSSPVVSTITVPLKGTNAESP